MFKCNNKTPERFTPFSSISFVDFEQVNVSWGMLKLKIKVRK